MTAAIGFALLAGIAVTVAGAVAGSVPSVVVGTLAVLALVVAALIRADVHLAVTVTELEPGETPFAQARAALKAVRALHSPTTPRDGDPAACRHCGQPWPCPTIQAIDNETREHLAGD